jgi:hypothetical protein
MINCLQEYLSKGLQASEFVNLKVRQLSAETSHDFIEWCGLIQGSQPHSQLIVDTKNYKHSLYLDFIEEYPDYAPKAKMTISRTRFYKWLVSFALFKEGVQPEEGRDAQGRWIRIRSKKELEVQSELDF